MPFVGNKTVSVLQKALFTILKIHGPKSELKVS